ncbi:hypothetical protein Ddc_20666 [Ditylenchus destructor]|nr:hypothetical protein Ddc_20666 [Ditylenchus destructor]
MGHYYSGSSPAFAPDRCDTSYIKNGSQEREFCPFIHYRNYSTKLEAILNRHFGKLDSFMASSILEVRQTVWLYEIDVIDAAIENHLDLKQFNVDRRTMPPELPQNPRYPPSTGWIVGLVAVYFLIWYFAECWALPFQESPCKRTRDLPLFSTNQSTLAEAVDEFTLALRSQIAKFGDRIEISHLAKRQALSNVTKNEIAQLFSRYSTDLIAFAAIKREDAIVREIVQAMSNAYVTVILFLIISMACMGIIIGCLHDSNMPQTRIMIHPSIELSQIIKNMQSVKENKNSQAKPHQIMEGIGLESVDCTLKHISHYENVRLKQLKKQIPLQYIATFVCIAAAVMLFFTFSMGHYYSGSSPAFIYGVCNMSEIRNRSQESEYCPFIHYLNFSTKLEAILNRHFGKLDSFMASSILEVRQTVWLYESDGIDAAIENHQELKQFNVDRRTMPPEIPQNSRYPPSKGIKSPIRRSFKKSFGELVTGPIHPATRPSVGKQKVE